MSECTALISAVLYTGEKSSIARYFDTTFYLVLLLDLCHNFNTILIIRHIYVLTPICINILPFIFDKLYSMLYVSSALVGP
jgi:hypothetical protein